MRLLSPPVIILLLLTIKGGASFVDIFFLCLSLPSVSSVYSRLVVNVRKELTCDVFVYFCHFPIWCPGSGMLNNCIDS